MSLSFYINLILLIFISTHPLYDNALKWAKDNEIYINNKLEMKFESVNNKYYYSKEEIEADETLLKVPSSLFLTPKLIIDNASKNLQKIYNEILSKFNLTNNSSSENSYEGEDSMQALRGEIAVLSIGLTKAIENQRGKIYEKYKEYFATFETNVDKYPIFFTQEQLETLVNTSFVFKVEFSKMSLREELSEVNKFLKKEIDEDIYYKYRALIVSKSLSLPKLKLSIVPFSDFFKIDIHNYNCKFYFEEDYFIINTTRKINKDENIYMKFFEIPNTDALIYYGTTFEDNQRIGKAAYRYIHPDMKKELEETYDLKLTQREELSRIDISNYLFHNEAIEYYSNIIRKVGKDVDEFTALKFLFKNLIYHLRGLYKLQEVDYYKTFFTRRDGLNAIRVVYEEKLLLSEKIEYVEKLLNDYAAMREVIKEQKLKENEQTEEMDNEKTKSDYIDEVDNNLKDDAKVKNDL